MQKTVIRVGGMSCAHCVRRVENALKGVEGTVTVSVDLASGSAEVQYDDATADMTALRTAIEDVGYEALS
ncbi:MAG: heavy-metal-associated domain-containing protein [Clostridia bacterium]|nr:heavy-metal-associated domain-containing protein [Clostridia bacterium]